MMTRLTTVTVVAATATLAKQTSAWATQVPSNLTPSPVEDPTGAPTSAPTSPDGREEEAVYIGCFHDNRGDRVLGHKRTSSAMTTEVCRGYCEEVGAAFMATQYGFECWCSPDGGLDYNRHYDIVGEDAVCDMPCVGDETQTEICGGFDSFELYKLVPASDCSAPVEVYEQCGGHEWTGSTCCYDGYECVEMGMVKGCYSQCRPMGTDSPTPSPMGTVSPTPSPVAMDRRTSPPSVTDQPVTPATPEVPPTPAPAAPETPAPVPAPTPSPVAPRTPAPVPAPTPSPVAPRTPAPVPEPTPAPVAPRTPAPVPEPTPAPVTPEPVTPPSAPRTSAPADMQDMLDLHNEARCIHDTDPLTWSSAVEASAAVHAKRMSDACDGLFHSEKEERNFYGENIYYCGGNDCYTADRAMNGEHGFYLPEVQYDSVTDYEGHATQILWKSTEKLGCATSKCTANGRTYLACQYDPPGNVMGRVEEEVNLPTNAGNC